MSDRNAHCGTCGEKFGDTAWPRTCAKCSAITYRNPTPVGVVLQPVDDGLLVLRRAIEPGKGKLALPGGFIDFGESWQDGAARELREETGVDVAPTDLELMAAHSTPNGAEVLLFAVAPGLTGPELPTFVPRPEVAELAFITEPTELAFPLHTKVAAAFFKR